MVPPRKALVIQTAFLGDIVLTTPFLANLRALAPQAEILFLTTPVGARILSPNPFGITVLPYDKRGKDSGFGGFTRMSRRLREFAPDLVFCLHRSLRSALLAKLAGGVTYGFREGSGSVMFDHRVARPEGLFEAEKNQRVLIEWAGATAAQQSVFPRLQVSEAEIAEAASLLSGVENFVALAPSSVWATKRWPAERFAQLASALWEKKRLPTVLVGGNDPADLEVASAVLAAFPQNRGAPLPLNLTGKTSLGSMKSVLSRAKLVVSNDSAPLHVAIAMGAPVLGVFGPTTKSLGFFPNAPAGKAAVAELSGLACRPCGMHGHQKCPLGHFKCMLDLTFETVLSEAERML
ncbi:MAG: glycosyltransferase family 9 protein [Bdellovibrionota bacterium]